MSSFNSFSRKFTSVYEPVTPLCSLNPQTVSSGLPSGWTLSTGNINFTNDGIRKYYRFPMTPGMTVLDRFVYNYPNTAINYGTNGGMTVILAVRINSTNHPLLLQGNLNVTQLMIGAPASANWTSVFGAYNGRACFLGGATNPSTSPNGNLMVGKNKFHFIAHVITNSTSQLTTYFEGNRFGSGSITNVNNVTTSATGAFSARTCWGFGGTYGIDYDLMYYAHYDRPLSDNDIKRVFNSISPLMEIGTVSPLFTTLPDLLFIFKHTIHSTLFIQFI